jgi:hypothetical protein
MPGGEPASDPALAGTWATKWALPSQLPVVFRLDVTAARGGLSVPELAAEVE